MVGLLVSACGKFSSEPTSIAQAVTSATDLPKCDASRQGALVYIVETKQFKYCDSGRWQAIDLQGDPGLDGAQGATGPTGATGVTGNAAGSTIVEDFWCNGVFGAPYNHIAFHFARTKLTSGDTFMDVAVSTWDGGASASGLFGPSQTTPALSVLFDSAAGAVGGTWLFESSLNGHTLSITYTDADALSGGGHWGIFGLSSCNLE